MVFLPKLMFLLLRIIIRETVLEGLIFFFGQVRGDLVNICIPGDVLRVVGIVKAMQVGKIEREGKCV